MLHKIIVSSLFILLVSCGSQNLQPNNMVVSSLEGSAKIAVRNDGKIGETTDLSITDSDIGLLKNKLREVIIVPDSSHLYVRVSFKKYTTDANSFKYAIEESLRRHGWLDNKNGIYNVEIDASYLEHAYGSVIFRSNYRVTDDNGRLIINIPAETSVGEHQRVSNATGDRLPEEIVELAISKNIKLFMLALLNEIKKNNK